LSERSFYDEVAYGSGSLYGQNYYGQTFADQGEGEATRPVSSDLFIGGLNGVEEAVKSVFGMPAGLFTGRDSLPFDIIGAPETMPGQLVQGAVQGLTGYALITGMIAGGLALGTMLTAALPTGAALLTLGGAAAGFGNAVRAGAATRATIGGLTKLMRTFRSQGGTSRKNKLLYNTMMGGITDFSAFKADESRFMEIIHNNTSMFEGFTSWVVGDEEDSVFEGRLKNMVDGLFIGLPIDTALVFRKMKHTADVIKDTQSVGSEGAQIVAQAVKRVLNDEEESVVNQQLRWANRTPAEQSHFEAYSSLEDALGPEEFANFRGRVDEYILGLTEDDPFQSVRLQGNEAAREELRQMKQYTEAEIKQDADYLRADQRRKFGPEEELFAGGLTLNQAGAINWTGRNGTRQTFAPDSAAPILLYNFHESLYPGLANMRAVDAGKKGFQGTPGMTQTFGEKVAAERAARVGKMTERQKAKAEEAAKGNAGASRPKQEADEEVLPPTADEIEAKGLGVSVEELEELKAMPDYDEIVLAMHLDDMGHSVVEGRQIIDRLRQNARDLSKMRATYSFGAGYINKQSESLMSAHAKLKTLDPESEDYYATWDILGEVLSSIWEMGEAVRGVGQGWGNLGLAMQKRGANPATTADPAMSAMNYAGKRRSEKMAELRKHIAQAKTDPESRKVLQNLDQELERAKKHGLPTHRFVELVIDEMENQPFGIKNVTSWFVSNIISGTETFMTAMMSPAILAPLRYVQDSFSTIARATDPVRQLRTEEMVEEVLRGVEKETRRMQLTYRNAISLARGAFASIGMDKSDPEYKGLDRIAHSLGLSARFGMQTDWERFISRRVGDSTMASALMGLEAAIRPGIKLPQMADMLWQNSVWKSTVQTEFYFKYRDQGLDHAVAAEKATQLAHQQMSGLNMLSDHFSGQAVIDRATRTDEGRKNVIQSVRQEAERTRQNREFLTETYAKGIRNAQNITLNRQMSELERETAAELPSKFAGLITGAADLVNKHPALRFFAPFTTVPTNSVALGGDVGVGGTLDSVTESVGRSWRRLSGAINLPGSPTNLKVRRALSESLGEDTFVEGRLGRILDEESGKLDYQRQLERLYPKFEDMDAAGRQAALKDVEARVAKQKGNVWLASLTTASVLALISDTILDPSDLPRITGGGPADNKMRGTLSVRGWQNYSIRIGDKYYSYLRAEPFSQWLGMAADLAQVSSYYQMSNTDPGIDHDIETAATVLQAMFTRQITDRSFLQGMRDFFDIMGGDSKATSNWLFKVARGVAVPAHIRQVATAQSPEYREAQSLLEELQTSIPGSWGRESVSDRRRNLLGEPTKKDYIAENPWVDALLPTRVTDIKDDVVAKAISAVPYTWRSAPRYYDNVFLLDRNLRMEGGNTLYDEWQERFSTMSIRGKTLRQALRVLVQDEEYLKYDPMPLGREKSYRARLIQNVISKYRKAAMNSIRKEHSYIDNAFRNARKAQMYQRSPESPTLFD